MGVAGGDVEVGADGCELEVGQVEFTGGAEILGELHNVAGHSVEIFVKAYFVCIFPVNGRQQGIVEKRGIAEEEGLYKTYIEVDVITGDDKFVVCIV